MKNARFADVLNDLWDYFVLADPHTLSMFQRAHSLPTNLMQEFASNETGDLAVSTGVVLPMSGIENVPYTVLFRVDPDDASSFDAPSAELQLDRSGYWLHVTSGELYLLTVWYLLDWSEGAQGRATVLRTNRLRPRIAIDVGYYRVEVRGGLPLQDQFMEPTFEVTFVQCDAPPNLQVPDINEPFTLAIR